MGNEPVPPLLYERYVIPGAGGGAMFHVRHLRVPLAPVGYTPIPVVPPRLTRRERIERSLRIARDAYADGVYRDVETLERVVAFVLRGGDLYPDGRPVLPLAPPPKPAGPSWRYV